jgi:hypothetical protein
LVMHDPLVTSQQIGTQSLKRYSRVVSGYHVIALKAASPHQGGIAVLWKPGHWDFEVEAVHIASPNILTFQLVAGGV